MASGTDAIWVARRETSGIECRLSASSGEAPTYFTHKQISGLRRSGAFIVPSTRRFMSGYRDRIRSGFRCNKFIHNL
jgi:hypothetical protein